MHVYSLEQDVAAYCSGGSLSCDIQEKNPKWFSWVIFLCFHFCSFSFPPPPPPPFFFLNLDYLRGSEQEVCSHLIKLSA